MSTNTNKSNQIMLFDKINYILLIVGLVVLTIGFMLLSGGKSPNPNEFLPDELYSFRRITLAPIVIVLGFLIEMYAIMRVPKVIK